MSRTSGMRIIALFFVSAIIFSCDPASQLPKAGSYQGTLIHVRSGQLEKLAVMGDVKTEGANSILIGLLRSPGGALPSVRLSARKTDSLDVTVEELGRDVTTLTRDSECFSAQDPQSVRVCLTTDRIDIEVHGKQGEALYSLSVAFSDKPAPLPLETPRDFTVSQAVKRAFELSFTTRMEFQRSSQAKLLAKNAYLNLLPHFTFGTIVTIAEKNPYALVAAVGDLAPFLLPSRWIHAREQSHLADAEEAALSLMRWDTGVEVEAFAYALDRDLEILKEYDAAIQDVASVQRNVSWREQLGDFPAGTANTLLTVMHNLESDRSILALNVELQKTFVAQSLGMINPKGVLSLTLEGDPAPIEEANPLTDEKIWQTASARSFELKQMDSLIAAAQNLKTAAFFEWLDPSGDPTAALGLGLPFSVSIKDSQLEQVKISRQQVQAILLQKVTQAVLEYNHSLSQYVKAKQDLALQEDRVMSTLFKLKITKEVSLLDLATVFQDRLRAQSLQISARAAYRIHRAKLDRLLLQGFYLPSENDRNNKLTQF